MGLIFVCKLNIIVMTCLIISYLTNETCSKEIRIQPTGPLMCRHHCSHYADCYDVMFDEVSLLCTLLLDDRPDPGNSNHSEKNNVQNENGAPVSSKEPHSRNKADVVKEKMVKPNYRSIKSSVKISINRQNLKITDLLFIDDFLYVAERSNKMLIKLVPCNNTFCEKDTMRLDKYPMSLASFNSGSRLVVAQGLRGKLSVIVTPSFTNSSFIDLHEPYSFSYQQLSSFNKTSIVAGSITGGVNIFILTFSGNNVVSWSRIRRRRKFTSLAVYFDGDVIISDTKVIACLQVNGDLEWDYERETVGKYVAADKYGFVFFTDGKFNDVYLLNTKIDRRIIKGENLKSRRKITALIVDKSGRVFIALTTHIRMVSFT